MSTAGRVASIDCKTCNAPLQLHGGHRVKTLTCGYCGTVMDVHDEFKILDRYQNLERPETPFQIGLAGKIKGVDFTVIGIVQYGYQDQWGTYTWVSSQLYSPTHGYAWITISDKGHVTFSRKVRELPSPAIPAGFTPKRSTISFRDRKFRFYERFKTFVLFVEGELTWQAAIHDEVDVAEFIAPPFAFEFESSRGELEYGFSEYMTADDVRAAFTLDRLPNSSGIHPAMPFNPGSLAKAVQANSYIFFMIAAVAWILVYVLGYGERVASQNIRLDPGSTASVPFAFDEPDHLLFIQVNTDVNNNWTYIEAEIVDRQDEPVAAVGREIGYYHGVSGGESWSEGSRKTEVTVKLPVAGQYKLNLTVDPQAPVSASGSIQIWQGYWPWRYFAGLTVVFLIGMVSLFVRKLLFEQRRWAEVMDDD